MKRFLTFALPALILLGILYYSLKTAPEVGSQRADDIQHPVFETEQQHVEAETQTAAEEEPEG